MMKSNLKTPHWTETRSLLFVPATSTHLLAKAVQRGADAVILDLEDSIPFERKSAARELLAPAVKQLAGQIPLLVRVNSSLDLLRDDVAALPLDLLECVLLPKVESAEQVRLLASMLAARQGNDAAATPIAALIETPLGILHGEEIATAHPSVVALGFGAEDYAASLMIEPRPEALLWPAQAVTNCARAFQLACWGLPGSVADIEDMLAFGRLVKQARDIGFTGTVCIHPRQVEVANKGFDPTELELSWARRVVAADQEARKMGKGAVILDGRMIDKPIVERAQRWLNRSTQ